MTATDIIGLSWALSELILNVSRRSSSDEKNGKDKSTLGLIWLVLIVSLVGGVMLAKYTHAAPMKDTQLAHAIGCGIIIAGMIFRITAIVMLGRFFTVDVAIRKNHQIVNTGFYRYIRHPSYTGALLSFFGFGIVQNNWYSFAVVFIPVCWAMILRINVEERALVEHFGEAYEEYRKKTWRLLPFVY